jgi:hypothetical protein
MLVAGRCRVCTSGAVEGLGTRRWRRALFLSRVEGALRRECSLRRQSGRDDTRAQNARKGRDAVVRGGAKLAPAFGVTSERVHSTNPWRDVTDDTRGTQTVPRAGRPPDRARRPAHLAAVAAVRDDLHRSARLSGAAAAHRYGRSEDPVDAMLRVTFFDSARTRQGGDAWDALAREGAALGFADAIAYALEDPSAYVQGRRTAFPM